MTFIEQWLRSDIKNINAYHVPDSKNLLKLDAMESPFGVPIDLKKDFLDYIDKAEVNRYPDAASTQLKDTLRNLMEVPKEFEILLGQRSIDIQMLLLLSLKIPLETLWRFQRSLKSFLVMVQMS